MNRRSAIEWSDGAAGSLLARDEDHALSWQDAAACASADPDAFFPEQGGSTRLAKAVCRACPVRRPCLEYALASNEQFGIYGGLTERERRRFGRVMPLELPEVRDRRSRVQRLEDGSKPCCRCGEVKPPGEYQSDAGALDGLGSCCKGCLPAQQAQQRQQARARQGLAA